MIQTLDSKYDHASKFFDDLSKPPVVMAGRRPAMTTGRPKADLGWLFKKTAIWRCEIVMESDTGSYLKVSRGYKVLSMILDLHVHFP